jgi:type I restriction-modification system DNA methylase subunit
MNYDFCVEAGNIVPKKQAVPAQPSISSQTIYYNNQQLFSDYFLSTILPKEDAWEQLSGEAETFMATLKKRFKKLNTQANEAQIEHEWIRPILEELGHTFKVQVSLRVPGSTQRPDYVFYTSAEQQAQHGNELDDTAAQHGAIAVGDAKQWDQPLDQMPKKSGDSASFSNKNPSFQIFFYMLHSKLPWGILTNGRKWRLYHESTAYKLEVYYEVDLVDLLEAEDVSKFLYFYAFFRRPAFDKGHPLALESILAASVESAQKIREDLSVQVYDALRFIAQGFLDYPQNKLTPTPATCRLIYENSLILLYRMLFILYAESRNLLPIEGGPYREYYSLRAISEQLRKDNKPLFSFSDIIWAQLKTLFISIDKGNTTLDINTFDGGLFDPDKVSFLEQYVVGDKSLAQAIDLLANARDARATSKGYRIDYRDLSERHLGTIYEGLLEYTLHVAEEPMVELRSTSMIVPEAQVSNRTDVARTYKEGEVYLVTDSGQRKITGSYYTPDYIVKYMVEQTLKPVLDDAVRRHAHEDNAAHIQAILEINVLDPAMGSGHFPVEVVEYIARYLVELGVQPEDKDEHEPDMTYWKRRVVQQCIYGVDANPLAVELAKLSLWLATAAKGYPLNFLDHHLRPGNALIGAWLEDVAGAEHPKAKIARERAQQQLAFPMVEDDAEQAEATQHSMLEDEDFRATISSALDVMSGIEQTPANTLDDVKRQEIAYAELRKHFTNKYQHLMDLGTALFYNLYIEHRLWRAAAEYAVQAAEQSEGGLFHEQYEQLLQQAYTLRKERGFFHWELEFPDIFFNHDGTPRQEAGFDVVIGNPPYVRQERLYADKPFYLDHYEIYHGTADLFVYFFAQGLHLLRPGGRLAYISSNSWLRANYATALRRYLRTSTTVEQIIDLGNTRVFADAPDLSPAIQIVRKQPAAHGTTTKVAIFSRGEQITEFRDKLSEERIIDISLHD